MSAVQRAARPPIVWSERVAPPRRQHLEDDLQRDVCKYLDVALPADATYFSVPNGGKRHRREAARMSGLGLRPGVPDLCVIFRGRSFFIELKSKRGVMSAEQKEMQRKLLYCGAAVCMCRSGPEVEAQLRECCIPLRATFT